MKYAFIVTILNSHTQTQVRNLLWNQSDSLANKLVGRDIEGTTPQRYVLGMNGIAATFLNAKGLPEEIEAAAYIGVNPNVSQPVRNVIDTVQQRAALVRFSDYQTAKTLAEMQADLRTEAGFECSKVWISQPGDNVQTLTNVDLLAKFEDV